MRKLFFLIAFSVAAAAQAAPPKRAEVGYQVERNGQALAEVSQRLEHDGKTYQLSETWKGKGMLALKGEAKRSSRGAVAADGLRPQHYEDQRPGRDAQKADFDPAKKAA